MADERSELLQSAATLKAAMGAADSARDLAGLARELRQTLGRLAQLDDGTVEVADPVDEIARKRAERRAAAEG